MRKVIIVPGILITLTANAQNYLINFAGTGAATTVTTVKVENLTSGTSLTLNGSEILRLTGSVGIPQLVNNNSHEMKIYPNPMNGNATLELSAPAAGNASITVYEMTGKAIAQFNSYLENSRQEFKLSGLNNGLYFINVTGHDYQYSGKLLCIGSEDRTLKIEKAEISKKSIEKKFSKKEYDENQASVGMPYTIGDRLKFTAISGIYTIIKTDIPSTDKTLTFNFLACKDGDNNNYPVVEIGTQIWTGLNLETTKYSDNTDIPLVTVAGAWSALSTPGYCWYNNNEATYKPIYGALYNWYAVNTGKLCPTGWHIPTDVEWSVLTSYLGGEAVAGDKLKEAGLAHWVNLNTSATNETGFTGLPGGYRYFDGSFLSFGDLGYWLSSSEYNYNFIWDRGMGSNRSKVDRSINDKRTGFSVRCLQD